MISFDLRKAEKFDLVLLLTGSTFSKGVQIFSKIKDEEISLIEFLAQFSWNLRQKQILLITSLQPSNPFISHTGNGFFIVLLERKMKTPWSNLEKFHFRRNILCMIFISSLWLWWLFLKALSELVVMKFTFFPADFPMCTLKWNHTVENTLKLIHPFAHFQKDCLVLEPQCRLWKFQNFSGTEILREINFREFCSTKTAITFLGQFCWIL